MAIFDLEAELQASGPHSTGALRLLRAYAA